MSEPDSRNAARYSGISAFLLILAGALMLASYEKPHPGAVDLPKLPTGDIAARKAAFFEFLRPIVAHHNERILSEREFILSLEGKENPGWLERRRFEQLAERYAVDLDVLEYDEAYELLKRRVDIVPRALVLIQAAKESGWGRSRFARQGNALFGEWCFTRGCGIVPNKRREGRRHEVRAFRDVHDSVGSYMDNLNSHRSYREMRIARERMRAEGEPLSALGLAGYMTRYSERRQAYVEEIRNMILQNGLESD